MISRIWLLLFLVVSTLYSEEVVSTKKVKLAWDEVEGSKAYELEIYKGEALLIKENLVALSWETRLEPGVYRYRVRALDEFERFGNWTSFEEFQIQAPLPASLASSTAKVNSKSSLKLMAAYGTYDYGSEVGGLGFGRANGATEFILEAGLQYWFLKNFAAGLDASYKSSELGGINISYPEFDLSLRYSIFKDSAFYLYPVLSFEYQNTPELSSSSVGITTLQNNFIRTIGLGLGAEAGFRFSEKWGVGTWFRYVNPVNYTGSNVEKGNADSSTLYRYGATLNYSLSPYWIAGLDFAYEYRKLNYETRQSSRANVYKDSMRGGLSLKTLFGNSD